MENGTTRLEQMVDEWQVPDPFDTARFPHLEPKMLALARDLRVVQPARGVANCE